MSAQPLRLGISACLLGQPVRYNGGHKYSSICNDVLAPAVEYVSFCPEQAAGFGTPRPAMHLRGAADDPQLVLVKDGGADLGSQLEAGYRQPLEDFDRVDGFILMQKSPSCGLFRVKLYDENGQQKREQTTGLFAKALRQRFPLLPIEEEGRLHNPQLFDNFMLRVQAHHHFRHQVLACPSQAALTGFHARYKYLLMAHSQQLARNMGRFLANSQQVSLEQRCHEYQVQLMQCLGKHATRKGHSNALQHMLGYLRGTVSADARQLLAKSIEQFRHGHQPLHVPLGLLHHYAAQLERDYLSQQQYFSPYPAQLYPANRTEHL